MDQRFSPAALARLSVAVAARETADRCYALVAHIADPELDYAAVLQIRHESAITWQRWILAKLLLAGGEPAWGEVADLTGWSEGSLRSQFEGVVEIWGRDPALIDLGQSSPEGTVGQVNDADPVGTAQSLDLWLQRHRDPWDDAPERSNPVEYALTHD